MRRSRCVNLRSELRRLGFRRERTGGNCTAFVRSAPGIPGDELIITDGDCRAPDTGRGAVLSLVRTGGEVVCEHHTKSSTDLLGRLRSIIRKRAR